MAGTLPNQGGSRDIDQKGQGQVWLRSVDEVNSEIDFVLKYLLNLNKRFKSQRNCGNLYETNKLLSDWNEELLLFCKTNRKKYMIDDKTSRMDKKLLEYETMLGQNQKRVDELKKELTEAIKAKDIALNRLSEIQSRLLKMNNPEITDLSDENRPTVLGEKLKRVYEDEWTDAFEFLTEKREEKLSEEQAIDILYSLLKKCHELGAEALRGQHVRLARIVNDPAYLKDILPAMKKTQEFPGDIFNNEFVVKYIEECFQLCWLMQVQCPPMLMDFDTKPGSAFDANFFDIYTNRGPKITMVVWPPVHLHKGGPLVSKGYAECAK